MKPIKAGILGAGFMGTSHARALLKAEGVTIDAVCSAPVEFAQKLVEGLKLTSTRVYDDFDRMLEHERLDVLYVCIPPHAHSGQIVRAARKGLHLMLEKPIAFDSAQAAEMVAAIEQAGVVSQVGFHFRFKKSVMRLKALIDSGAAGNGTLYQGRFWMNSPGKDWWRDRTKARAQIYEQLIHFYDLARYLLGAPKTVSGMTANLCHGDMADYTIEDTSIGTMRFAGGAMAVVTGSNCAVPMHFFGDFSAVFRNATLHYTSTGQSWVAPDRAVLQCGEKEREEFVEDGDAYLPETEDFLRAVRDGGRTLTPAREGLEAIRLVEKVMQSAEAGGTSVAY